ncbi:hypothetical protein AGR6A_Lc140012 [Agrobacterium sp. NCPPB 925]|nr:hypothetical protein AGR6A_Lc140012 [Agrobacterium sp. NCPPB 925]
MLLAQPRQREPDVRLVLIGHLVIPILCRRIGSGAYVIVHEPLSSNRGNGKLSLATKLPTYCLHFAFDKRRDPCHIAVANLKLQRWRAGGRFKKEGRAA